MFESLALGLLLAETNGQPTLPRQREPTQQERREQDGTPTDPLFDQPFVATDDHTFVRNAIEASRQGVFDAQAAGGLGPQIESAAEVIERQYAETRDRMEGLAKRKRWPVPEEVERRKTSTEHGPTGPRKSADFIVSQIAAHQAAVKQFRAQMAGTKDPELKRALGESLAGYEKNLEMLVELKYQP